MEKEKQNKIFLKNFCMKIQEDGGERFLELDSFDGKSLEENCKSGADFLEAVNKYTKEKKLSSIKIILANNRDNALRCGKYLAEYDDDRAGANDTMKAELPSDWDDYEEDEEPEEGDIPAILHIEEADPNLISIPDEKESDVAIAKKSIGTLQHLGMFSRGESILNLENRVIVMVNLTEKIDEEQFRKYIDIFANFENLYIAFICDRKQLENENLKSFIYKMELEYDADVLDCVVDEENLKKYQAILAETIADELGYQFSEGFDMETFIQKVWHMKQEYISVTIRKLLRHAAKNKPFDYAFVNEDFEILNSIIHDKKVKQEEKEPKTDFYNLVGRSNEIKQLEAIIHLMEHKKKCEERGIENAMEYKNTFAFLGAPGTAKTVLAKGFAKTLKARKLIPDESVTVVNAADLKGKYQGHSTDKVKQVFQKNSVIVIDEAYSIVTDTERDMYGQEVISQLLVEIEEMGSDKVVIFAGYGGKNVTAKDNKMQAFFDANPGIKSRINKTIYLSSYDADEMVKICHGIATSKGLIMDCDADTEIRSHYETRCKSSNFGNGREARQLIDNSYLALVERLAMEPENSISNDDMIHLRKEDILEAIESLEEGDKMQEGAKKARIGFM